MGGTMQLSNRTAIVVAIVAVIAIIGSVTPGYAAQRSIGKVSQKAYIGAYGTPAGGSQSALYYNDKVYQQELVRTIENGRTVIRFLDRTKLQLGSASELVLDTFVYDPDESAGEMLVNLGPGAFRFITGKLKFREGFQFKTPLVAIGVRGTVFLVTVAANGATQVAVLDGEVEVAPLDGSDGAVINANQTGTVTGPGSAVSVTAGTGISTDPGLDDNPY